jgi:uncharacterized membrane protein HdeD (DUF308 family)
MTANYNRLGWMFLVRGVLAIVFGVLALIWPQLTLEALVYLFGAYVLIEGIFTLITLFTDRASTQSRILGLLEGLLDIGLGIFTFIFSSSQAWLPLA